MANTAKSYIPSLSSEVSTATATAGAATLNAQLGTITTEALTTAQDATYTLTLTNNFIAAGSIVIPTLANGSNTQGTPLLGRTTPAAGSCTITVTNKHASAQALNGTLKIGFVVL